LRDYKLAYLAVKKCGCTSIASYIAGHKTKNIVRPLWPSENAKINFDFVTADESELQDYFTFTFVRNPYTRLLSFYRNWIVNPPNTKVVKQYEKFSIYVNMDFEAFIRAFVMIKDKSLLEGHTVPMYKYVFRKRTPRVKFIGKLENIDVDFKYVKNACALKGELDILNKSHAESETGNFNSKLRVLVYDFYRDDFEIFGYNKY